MSEKAGKVTGKNTSEASCKDGGEEGGVDRSGEEDVGVFLL